MCWWHVQVVEVEVRQGWILNLPKVAGAGKSKRAQNGHGKMGKSSELNAKLCENAQQWE